jgi:hypothetical protein
MLLPVTIHENEYALRQCELAENLQLRGEENRMAAKKKAAKKKR